MTDTLSVWWHGGHRCLWGGHWGGTLAPSVSSQFVKCFVSQRCDQFCSFVMEHYWRLFACLWWYRLVLYLLWIKAVTGNTNAEGTYVCIRSELLFNPQTRKTILKREKNRGGELEGGGTARGDDFSRVLHVMFCKLSASVLCGRSRQVNSWVDFEPLYMVLHNFAVYNPANVHGCPFNFLLCFWTHRVPVFTSIQVRIWTNNWLKQQ